MALGTAGTVVIAALVAGAAGAGTTLLLKDSPRPAAPPSAADDRVASLEERVGRQQTEIASLRVRLEEASHAGAPPPPPAHPGGDGHRPSASPDGDAAANPAQADISPEEKAKFETVYRQMREKEQEDAKKARLASFETGLRNRLDRMSDKVVLTPEQKETIVRVMKERSEKVRAVFEESREIGTPEASRAAQEKMMAIRQESRQTLLLTLTEDQVAAVESVADRSGLARTAPAGLGNGTGEGRRNPRGNAGGGANGAGGTTPPR